MHPEGELAQRVDIPADAAELAHRIVEIASDKKANDIVMLRQLGSIGRNVDALLQFALRVRQ